MNRRGFIKALAGLPVVGTVVMLAHDGGTTFIESLEAFRTYQANKGSDPTSA